MAIKAGDKLPDGKLMESTEFDSGTQCAMPPQEVNVAEAAKGKKIAVFGLPGAYTPTCSAKHVPSYVHNRDALKAKGVDDVVCMILLKNYLLDRFFSNRKNGAKSYAIRRPPGRAPRSAGRRNHRRSTWNAQG